MIRDIFRVFISSAFVQVLGAVRSFLLPVFLVPEQLGIWNLLNTIVGYGANSHIGLLHGMNKSIPRITADGDLVFRQSLKDSVFWINILLALLFSIAIAFFIFLKLSYSWQKAALVGAVIVIQSVYIYYLCLMRADSKFKAFSAISTFFSVILTAMVVGLVILVDDKVVGGLIGLLIAQLAVVVVLVKMTNYKFNFTVNWADIRHALSLGFPVLMIGLVDMVLLTLDRWLIVWRFTGKDLGIYAFAIVFSVIIGSIPIAVGQVAYPFFLRNSRTKIEVNATKNFTFDTIPAVALCTAVMSISLHFLVPFIVTGFYPKYIESIQIAQVLIPAAFFLSLTHISGTYLIAVNGQNKLLIVQLISVIIGFIACLLFIKIKLSLVSLAYGIALMYLICGSGYLFLAKMHACSSLSTAISYCLKILIPYIAILSIAFAIPGVLLGDGMVHLFMALIFFNIMLIIAYTLLFNESFFYRYAINSIMRFIHNRVQ